MIARIWRTGLHEAGSDEYLRFAVERSLPMFRRQAGCRGVLFTRSAGGRAVITLWRDHEAVAALEASGDYRETVSAIVAAGFLDEPQTTELLEVEHWWLAPDGAEPGSGR